MLHNLAVAGQQPINLDDGAGVEVFERQTDRIGGVSRELARYAAR